MERGGIFFFTLKNQTFEEEYSIQMFMHMSCSLLVAPIYAAVEAVYRAAPC